jgi:polyhydroxyalkanoate synthesis regulator phasin
MLGSDRVEREGPMVLDDARRTIEAAIGTLTPARAQQLAKGLLEPGAAKEQVARTAADILEWQHKNRERVREFVRNEVQTQMKQMGGATQDELDALKKRVRELERGAGMTASGRSSAQKPAAKRSTAKTSRAKTSGAKRSGGKKSTASRTASTTPG